MKFRNIILSTFTSYSVLGGKFTTDYKFIELANLYFIFSLEGTLKNKIYIIFAAGWI